MIAAPCKKETDSSLETWILGLKEKKINKGTKVLLILSKLLELTEQE